MSDTLFTNAYEGHTGVVEGLLLAKPAAIHAKDEDERTALHWACSGSRLETAAMLLEKGASADVPDDSSWTPLHIAASVGCDEIVKLLLQQEVEVGAKNESGRTAV
jgi:26S proteasome non-ATPase regulatory subunit 10